MEPLKAELAAAIRRRVLAGTLDHPGQTHPVEHYLDRGTEVRPALYDAALLLVDDDDPTVLTNVLHLAAGHPDEAFWAALVARLDGSGPALPDGLAERVAAEVANPAARSDALRGKAIAAFVALGLPEQVLRLQLEKGSTSARVTAVAKAAIQRRLDASLASFAGWTLADEDGAGAVLGAAAALWTCPEEVRAAFRDGAVEADPAWARRDDLTQALRLEG